MIFHGARLNSPVTKFKDFTLSHWPECNFLHTLSSVNKDGTFQSLLVYCVMHKQHFCGFCCSFAAFPLFF